MDRGRSTAAPEFVAGRQCYSVLPSAYEGFRLRESVQTTQTLLLPSARQGLFSYIDQAGVTRQINVLTAAGARARQTRTRTGNSAGSNLPATLLNPNGTYNFVGTNAGGANFFNWDKNNFAPVFSFAYSPNFKNRLLGGVFPGSGRTVIRGGYRISYVNDELVRGADNALTGNQGLTQGVSLTNLNLRASGGSPSFATPAFQVPRSFAFKANEFRSAARHQSSGVGVRAGGSSFRGVNKKTHPRTRG